MAKDYYATLGVQPGATGDEVKAAFRRLAQQYHPDVNKEPGAEEHFKEVNEAYAVLSDPEKRAAYDRYGEQGLEGFGGAPDFSSFDVADLLMNSSASAVWGPAPASATHLGAALT